MDSRTTRNLKDVHPDLVRVVEAVYPACRQPFHVTEGRRTMARQQELVRQGLSKTLNSRHLTGHAVDVVAVTGPGRITWALPAYASIADAILDTAGALGIRMRWGGDWNMNGRTDDETFVDGPHFELLAADYPPETDPLVASGRRRPPAPADAEAAAAVEATLRLGDRGAAVRDLQTRLGIVSDGIFGLATRRAVMAFQASRGLAADGICGPATRAALDAR